MNVDRVPLETLTDDGVMLHGWLHPGEGMALLLLHDLDVDSTYWNDVVRHLERRTPGRPIVALDARCHGRSDVGTEFTRKRLVKDVKVFLKAHDLGDAVICGHGWGADIALATDFGAGVIAVNPLLGRVHAGVAASLPDLDPLPTFAGARETRFVEAFTIGIERAKPLRRNRRDAPTMLLYSAPVDVHDPDALDRLIDVCVDAQEWQDGTPHLPLEAPAGVAALIDGWCHDLEAMQ